MVNMETANRSCRTHLVELPPLCPSRTPYSQRARSRFGPIYLLAYIAHWDPGVQAFVLANKRNVSFLNTKSRPPRIQYQNWTCYISVQNLCCYSRDSEPGPWRRYRLPGCTALSSGNAPDSTMLAEVKAGMVRRDEPPAELSRTFSARYALYIDGSFTPLEPKQHGHLRDLRFLLIYSH